jgi:predicted transposase/invertase (TIGR01784 family)
LLYTVQIDNHPALLYCLFEHQSKPDPWMPLRLLRYILGIWDQFRKQNPKATKLPPILPVVLYQGGEAWTTDTSLSTLIEIPEGLATFQPDFQHLLIDLNDIAAEEIQGTPGLKTILLALKSSRAHATREQQLLIQFLAAVIRADPAMIRTVMLYLYSVDNSTSINEYIQQAAALKQPELQEEIMTIAETLRKEGRQQGMQQGRQEELREDIKEFLDERFGECSYAIIEALSMIDDIPQLRSLLRLAVRIESLAAFENTLKA